MSPNIRATLQFLAEASGGLRHQYFGRREPWLARNRNTHRGETCFVLGNGPSLADVDAEDLSRLPTFGTNGIYLKYTPTYYVTVSLDYYKNCADEIRRLKCQRKFIPHYLADLHTDSPDESRIDCCLPVYGRIGPLTFPVPLRFSQDASRVTYLGGTVLFACLQIALWLGFRNVVLLGVDHDFGFPRSEAQYGGRRLTNDIVSDIHFSREYSRPDYAPHCDPIATERCFSLAGAAFESAGGKILNATEGSKLTVLEQCSLGEALQRFDSLPG